MAIQSSNRFPSGRRPGGAIAVAARAPRTLEGDAMTARGIALGLAVALTGLPVPVAATLLPPPPDSYVQTGIVAGGVRGGGFGIPRADLIETTSNGQAVAKARVFSNSVPLNVTNGVAEVGAVGASARQTGGLGAQAASLLSFWMRNTETTPLPGSLAGLPITLTV
ncbi:MAG: hypothetical protein JOZ05_14330, partial [Acetobacteraceae bacterium]|nr:hypothetical protein [Acetobacteraceae bacterium]